MITKNEGIIDKSVRFIVSEILFILAFFWLWDAWQTVAYIVALVMLITSLTSYCPLYQVLNIKTTEKNIKTSHKIILSILVVLAIILPTAGSYYSNFFTKKIFLEDFGRVNNYYKQTLFFTGQNKLAEAKDNYDKLKTELNWFTEKYNSYKPYAIKNDLNLNTDLQTVSKIVEDQNVLIGGNNLSDSHVQLEKIRPILQDILKRNNFSPLAVALIDFHDAMEVVIDYAVQKDTQGIINSYTEADSKLKVVENELNDDSIKSIREQLDKILDMAKNNNTQNIDAVANDLKSSYVKVYLKKG